MESYPKAAVERAMKVQEVIMRAMAKKITWRQAGEIIGLCERQMHISKEGDRYLRTLLVQGAHYIMGPFGEDSDLRRWRLQLAERGGKTRRSGRSLRWRESWRSCCIGCGSAERCTNHCETIAK
jgi:hypothetical protein